MRPILLLPFSVVVAVMLGMTVLPGSQASERRSGSVGRAAPTGWAVPAAPTDPAAPGAEAVSGPPPGPGAIEVPLGPTAPFAAPLAAPSPAPRGRWAWPLAPRPPVLRPFVRPATRYGVGHRGVDLSGSAGQDVLAVDAGTVTHVGRIAGRGTVTVLHASGVRSTYEPVTPTVSPGVTVAAGTRLGRLEVGGSHCAPAACLHLGAVRGTVYLDPLVFLVGGRPVRLLPLGQAPEG